LPWSIWATMEKLRMRESSVMDGLHGDKFPWEIAEGAGWGKGRWSFAAQVFVRHAA